METGVSDDVRACVERNQRLIDAVLTRRAHDERRCDLYQRVQHAQDAKRRELESATAVVQTELLATLEKVYILDQQRGRRGKGFPAKRTVASSPSHPFDASQQLRSSLHETQRYNEALRVEILHHASTCDALKRTAQDKEVHCCTLQDQMASERMRATHDGSTNLRHASDVRGATEEVGSFAEALLMDTTQFYQRAFGAARDDVVDYIALQDEFYTHLRRIPSHTVTATSFEASLTNSVQLFLNTYTQLRHQEQQRYQEIVRTLTRLLHEPKRVV